MAMLVAVLAAVAATSARSLSWSPIAAVARSAWS